MVLAFCVVAMAQPQWGFVEREVKQRGRDVIIAVDTSRSMLATDVVPRVWLARSSCPRIVLKLVQR